MPKCPAEYSLAPSCYVSNRISEFLCKHMREVRAKEPQASATPRELNQAGSTSEVDPHDWKFRAAYTSCNKNLSAGVQKSLQMFS